jgi:hypothetical protein
MILSIKKENETIEISCLEEITIAELKNNIRDDYKNSK